MKYKLKSAILAGLALIVSLLGIVVPTAHAEGEITPVGNSIGIEHEYYVVAGAPAIGIEFKIDYITEEEHGNTAFTYTYSPNPWQYQSSSGSYCTPVSGSAMSVCTPNSAVPAINFTNFLSQVPHAGVYLFEVTQIEDSTTNNVTPPAFFPKIKESKAVYELRVYVKNSGTGHEIEYFTLTQTKDDNGVDLADENGEYAKTSRILFKTVWEDVQPLEISKAVAGDYSNKQASFQFNFTLSNPAFIGSSYTGRILDASGSFVENVTATVGTPATFNLKHGWKLVFEDNVANATNAFPAGTQYELVETFSEGYTPTVSVNSAADATTTVPGGCTEDCDTVLSGATIVSNTTNTAAWTNTYKTVSPTGIIFDNLPYILAVVVAVGGFSTYLVLKRKQAKKAVPQKGTKKSPSRK